MRKKTDNQSAEKSEYSILNHFRYGLVSLKQKRGTMALLIYVAAVASGILFPCIAMAFPSAAAANLTSGRTPGRIMAVMTVYIILLEGTGFLQEYIKKLNKKNLFLHRYMLGTDFYRKCLEVEDAFLESDTGQKKMRAACDTIFSGESMGMEAFMTGFWEVFMNLGGFLVYAVLMGCQTPFMLIGVLVQTILTVVFHQVAQKKGQCLEKENRKNRASFWALRRESISPQGMKEVYLFRMDRWFIQKMNEDVAKIEHTIHRRETAVMAAKLGEAALALIRDGILYAYLLWMMGQGRLTLARFLLYVGIVAGFGKWMVGLFDGLQKVWINNPMINDWRNFMNVKTSDNKGKEAVSSPGKQHTIRLENVCFRYEGNDEDTIKNISLTIEPGEKIALVGANGAGKTTLVKLICGLYHPVSGKIYLDGQDVALLEPYEYFKEFAVVFQDVFAFSFPLGDNVSCRTKKDTDAEKLKCVLEKADLWKKVETFPKGVDTVMNKNLDPEGVSLSGGELQKLMLARALYKDAPVVILDEPTAALDPVAESQMYEKYYEMVQEKSSIFISHRLSSTRFCNRILFLENGEVAEEGSHEELMEKQGSYAKMFETQAQYYRNKRQRE